MAMLTIQYHTNWYIVSFFVLAIISRAIRADEMVPLGSF